MIKNNDDLVDYIKRKLGYPSVRVEVTDDQLQDCIDYSIKEFSSFALDGELQEVVILTVDGTGNYDLPPFITSIKAVRSISNFSNYGSNYVPDRWSELYNNMFSNSAIGITAIVTISSELSIFQKYMTREINYSFNEYKAKLRLFEKYSGNLLVHYTYEYTPDRVDKIFNQQWVKDMAVAQARMIQSTVTGKYNAPLVGGSTVNYDNMRSLAESEIESLRDQLFSKYGGPAPILIA